MSLRKYLTTSEFAEITGEAGSVTDALLNQCESLIDQACADFLGSYLEKSMNYEILEEASTVTTTTATLSNTYPTNYLQYCVVHVLNGAKAGSISSITASSSNSITFDTITSLTGTVAIKIYQLGKFPMLKDRTLGSNTYYKVIPREIKEAVAWQCSYLLKNPKVLDKQQMQSENIGGSYSYTRASTQDRTSIIQMLAPRTIQLLQPYLLQTL
jgi:hypothetical protein